MPSPQDGATPERGTKRPKIVRLARAAVVVLASLLSLYLVAINVFLSTSLFTKVVNGQPDTIEIHFERGWSIVPRHIHARKLSVRGRDANVEWLLRLDAVEFDVSFLGLLRQRFEASNVHGDGLSLRLRQRLAAAPASPEEVRTLPPIDGLPAYAIRPPKAPSPELWSDADYHLWTVKLEGIVAREVREVWIDHARFEGHARIDGRFYLKPLRAVDVGPARIAVASGGVFVGETPVVEALDGSDVDLTLASFDPRTADGAVILHGLAAASDARAKLPDLGRLPLPLPPGVALRGAAELRRGVVHVVSGTLESDSAIELAAPGVVVSMGQDRVRGGLAIEADVARVVPGGRRDRLTLRAAMENLEVSRAGDGVDGTAFLRAPRLVVTGDSEALDLARALEDLHFVIEMPQGELTRAQALSRAIPPKTPVALVGGRGMASARLEVWLAEKRAAGRGELHAKDLDLRLAKMRVRGHLSVAAAFDAYLFEARRLEGATLAMEVTDGSLASVGAPATPLVHLSGAHLDAQAPVVDLADPLRALSVGLSLPAAEVVSAGLLQAYLPRGTAVQTASRSRFSLEGHLAIVDHRARGALDLESRAARFVRGRLRLDAGVRARARVHDWRWETGDLALDEASVHIDHLAVRDVASADRAPALSVARIAVDAKSPRFDLSRPMAGVTLSVALADANVRDSAAVNAFLPEGASYALDADGGHFEARLELDVDDDTARGSVRARATGMGAANATLRLRGDVEVRADFVDWKLEDDTMTLLDAGVAMARVVGRFGAPGPPQFSAERVALTGRSPRLDLRRPSLGGADFHLVVEKAELPDARALASLSPPGGTFGVESGAASVAADVDVSHSRGTARGGVDLAVVHGAVRADATRLAGNFRVRARIVGFDPDGERLDLAGTRLEMRDVAVTGASATTSDWRGDVVLSPASLRLAGPMLFDGVVRLEARDARPLLAILFGTSLPRFVVGLIAMPGLRASVRLVAAARQLALLDLDARGGNVAIRGSYAVRDGQRRGALIARKAFLSVGLRLDDDGARLRLFGLERWLRDQTHLVHQRLEVQGGRE